MMMIRPAHLSDLPYLYSICHDSAADGRGAEDLVRDRAMVGHFFAAPYLFHPAGLAFVLAADGLPVGYVVGAVDSTSFYRWLEADWLPDVRALYATVGEAESDFEAWLLATIRGAPKAPEFLAAWPGHLHINIDAAHRGGGFGRRLFEAWRTELWARGVSGFHLGVSGGNGAARGFYASLGLRIIREETGVVWMAQDNPEMPIRGSAG
jgi:ribosomal protein S18 acetylase RimI-like enzyme